MSLRWPSFLAMVLAASLALLICLDTANAQSTDTSSIADTGLQILQGLSPEQRSSILQQIQGGGGTLGGTAGGRSRDATEEQQNLERTQREALVNLEARREEMQRLSPYLEGEDWVVITIDSNPLPAVPTTNLAQSAALSALPNLPPGVLSSLPAAVGPTAGSAASGASAAPGGAAAALAAGAGNTTTTAAAANVNAGGYAEPPEGTAGRPPSAEVRRGTRAVLTDEERAQQRQGLIDLIRSKNPYQLSKDGMLGLPGFVPIPLAGLTEQLATLRLGVEPALRSLFIRVTKLPLKKVGPTRLKPFGYELFQRSVSTFAPGTNVPVPANYVVGPGDQLEVQLYGNRNAVLNLAVGRDGRVQFPDLGPVTVGGMTFDAAKATLEGRVARQMIGVHASVAMADTRSILVFVLGEAARPGTYTISGLGTITSALYAAGGIQTTGSLRKIQLKRQGALVRQLDLYDMLVRGNTTDDAKLLSGDVIFIPPVGPTISVDGEVRRPAIYETKGPTSLEDVVELAGGLTAEADTTKAALTRIDANQHRVVVSVDLSGPRQKDQTVRDGDLLRVPRLRPTLDAGVLVEGYVYSTGAFAYHDGLRLSDVIHSADDLKPNADLHYLLVRRELQPDRRVVVLSADLEAALSKPGSAADLVLMSRDRITIFDLQSSRDRVIRPLLEDLRLQSNNEQPTEVVRVDGQVNVPGEYPLEENMTVRDLVRAGGSLSDAAYSGEAELTRYKVVKGEARRTELLQIDLAAVMRGDAAANVRLEPFDTLSVKEVQGWNDQEDVTLLGEVKFPGRYSIRRGETLKSVLLRAGGLTDLAFVEGAVFTRRELREREQKQLDMFATRMQNDIAFLALQGANSNQGQAGTALLVGNSLLEQLRSTKAVGRLVIDLKSTLGAPIGSRRDILLRGGDQLLIPKYQQEVTVMGEVQTTTSHLYRSGLSRDDYIALSGGETVRADKGRIYVVRADGSVVANSGARWFQSTSVQMRPGDTVVVPLNAEHIPPLPFWQAVTQIIYNVAIAAAAVHSF